jgi:UDP-N-acetylglucosamine--N-acetylmuramyl-(pentapeptide) pyrophosphoryl-undecaprenol N-acetylglucosamine transferase
MENYRFIISGGGTGGHTFPAISIADGLKERFPDCEILFVGAENKMEMEKVPAAGYNIVGLPVAGFHRGEIWRNLLFVPKLIRSMLKASRVVKRFKPDCAIGVGGYASGPVLRVATKLGIPTVLQEQNSFAGVTNRILGKRADKICVAYDKMDRFFPSNKIVFTGNPVRQELLKGKEKVDEAKSVFSIKDDKPVLLIVGGSLGARSINRSILKNIDKIKSTPVNVIWQTGRFYYEDIKNALENDIISNLTIMEFIPRMDLAYAISKLVISRAGAGTISELCLTGKPAVLVPSPNVAEDHQTQNAMALVNKNAAILVEDVEADEVLVTKALEIIMDKKGLDNLESNILELATPNATNDIVDVIEGLIKWQSDKVTKGQSGKGTKWQSGKGTKGIIDEGLEKQIK